MNPNIFRKEYYPNVCFYCYRFAKNIYLIRCKNCKMISYCSKSHQNKDLPIHLDLCIAIRNVFKIEKLKTLKTITYASGKEWNDIKLKIIREVAFKLGRPFFPYEFGLLLYPRTCVVCHKRRGTLINCPSCPNVSFCRKHNESPVHEKKICEQMKWEFDINMVVQLNYSGIMNLLNAINVQHLYPDHTHSMQDFLKFYTNIQNYNLTPDVLKAILSDSFTTVLTLFHGIRILNLNCISNGGNLVIYVISPKRLNTRMMWIWECLLHLLSSVRVIEIVFISKNLTAMTHRKKLPLCTKCKSNKKMLLFWTCPLVYLTCMYQFPKPDVIELIDTVTTITYKNKGVVIENSFMEITRKIFAQQCPCIFTTNTLEDMESTVNFVKTTLNKDVKPIYQDENPFRSNKPLRNILTETIEFDNAYLFIYKALYTR